MTPDSLENQPSAAIDGLLASYAAGQLSPALHALVAGHLSLREENRDFVRSLEHAAAGMLDVAPEALSDRTAMLAAILDSQVVSQAASQLEDPLLPPALIRHIGCAGEAIRWRFLLPGMRKFTLAPDQAGLEAQMLWIRAGRRMPSHTHAGSEYTLVLQGGFSDQTGHYRRGDIAVADQDLDHKPVADGDMDCICFAVTDAPLQLTGPIARFFRRFTGH